jgi:hypothetical protein
MADTSTCGGGAEAARTVGTVRAVSTQTATCFPADWVENSMDLREGVAISRRLSALRAFPRRSVANRLRPGAAFQTLRSSCHF